MRAPFWCAACSCSRSRRCVVARRRYAIAAARPRARRRGPNILLITLDTTRADRMGFLGSTRGLTPSLDALRERRDCVHARLRAGADHDRLARDDPHRHVSAVPSASTISARRSRQRAVPAGSAAPRRLSHGAFVGSLVLDPASRHGAGLRSRFDRLRRRLPPAAAGRGSLPDRRAARRRGRRARAAAWIAGSRRATAPCVPVGSSLRRARSLRSAGGSQARASQRALRRRDRRRRSPGGAVVAAAGADAIVVDRRAITAKSLGDHGEDTHGVFLYDATLHVPLVVRLPGRQGAAARVVARVRLADVAPTILEAAGIPVPATMQGESLLLVASGQARAARRVSGSAGRRVEVRRSGRSDDSRSIGRCTPRPTTRARRSGGARWRRGARIGFCSCRRRGANCTTCVADPRPRTNLRRHATRVADGMDAELAAVSPARRRRAAATEVAAKVDPAHRRAAGVARLCRRLGQRADRPASIRKIASRRQHAARGHRRRRRWAFASAIPLLETRRRRPSQRFRSRS